ncbi:MAG: HAMP domain-containing sensor histidine kinase [Deferrisomatales bacterium]
MDILLIDDEANVREPLGLYLQEQDFRVRTASSGEEGLWLLEERPADLVISDVKMPGMSGIEVLRRVRERWPATEVVLVTGYGTMDDALAALRLGAYDFLLKPVRVARLELVVRHCAERIRYSKDNRDLREVVERLRELNERKEKFTALANHEMRTPTTVAAGLISLLADRAAELPAECRRLVCEADRAMRRLKEVVEDLGDLGLAQSGGLELQRGPVAVGDLVDGLRGLCDTYRSLRDLALHVVPEAGAGQRVHVDARKLLRAVGALVQNAVKYTPDGGEVTVRVGCTPRDLVFSVEDTGVGVAEGEEKKIFDLFYESADVRHHRTSSYEFGGGGLGVGLPLADAIARAHGGGVEYEARNAKGSIFRVRVPRSPDRAGP